MLQQPAGSREPVFEPSLRRLPIDAPGRALILRAHAAAVTAGRPSYRDPGTGRSVMTAAALLDNGSCCGCGCRHCPYVP